MTNNLSEEQNQRYLRNIILPEIGPEGQQRLLNSKILVIGAGGLGSAAIYYLAAAGVGCIGIADADVVELSNLQRQIIHNFADVGKSKVQSAAQKVNLLNADVQIIKHQLKADATNLPEILAPYDAVLDATDNFPSRFVINQACHAAQKPLIFAAVKGFAGQVAVFKSWLPQQPCYACFNPNVVGEGFSLPLAEKGILGAVAGTAACMQAANAIKEILQIGDSLLGKMVVFDLLRNDFRTVSLKKSAKCVVCG
jgi:molybdopterin-synthase adenylyltransferase